MTVLELIYAIKRHPPATPEEFAKLVNRVREQEAEFEEAAERRRVTQEALDRVYTI